jgi:DNA-binding XRE family transcriptional regulator
MIRTSYILIYPVKQGSKLALLRKVCRMPQHVLASMEGRSVHSIRAIEQGKFGVGEHLASQISRLTGVSSTWLLDDSPGPPLDEHGHKITNASVVSHFLAVSQDQESKLMRLMPNVLGLRLQSALEKAEPRSDYLSFAVRVSKVLDQLEQEIKAARASEKEEPDQETKSSESKKKRP